MKKSISALWISAATGLLVLLWSYTALQKLVGFHRFVVTLRSTSIPLLPYSAGALLVLELGIVILLLFSRTQRWGALLSTVLLLCFSVYIGCMLAFQSHLPCSCGGVLENMSWPQHLVFNLFFLVLSILVLLYGRPVKHIAQSGYAENL
jgi:hypothetical protein